MSVEQRADGRIGLRDLFAQVFSDRSLIPAERYVAYNAFVGLVLLLVAVLFAVEPRPENAFVGDTAILPYILGGIALVLLAGPAVVMFQPAGVRVFLLAQGMVLAAGTIGFIADGIHWALWAPPLSHFGYLPGLFLIPFTYGMLQVAAFGPWATRARRVRMTAFVVGVMGELALAACLLLRLFHQ